MILLRLLTQLKLLSREIGLIVREVMVNLEKMLVHREIEKRQYFFQFIQGIHEEYNSTTSGFQIYQTRKTEKSQR